MKSLCLIAGLVMARSVSGGAPNTNPAAVFSEFSAAMERLRRNEAERVRAEVEAERLLRERARLQEEQAASEIRRERLQVDVRDMRGQIASMAMGGWTSNACLMALARVALTPDEGPQRMVEPLAVVTLVDGPRPDGTIRVRLDGCEYATDAAAFASEIEIVARLQRRLDRLESETPRAPSSSGPAGQIRTAIEEVRRAFRRQATPPSGVGPTAAPAWSGGYTNAP